MKTQETGAERATTGRSPQARNGIRGDQPYGAPQLDVPYQLNTNENPYAPSDTVIATIAADVASAATTLNRYPDRDFTALRHDLADFLRSESSVALDPAQIWAANGSNEVMLHILQAFGGPGRTALAFTPAYAMYSEYARDTLTEWTTIARRDDFTIDLDAAATQLPELAPAVIFLTSPNNPTGTALAPGELRAILDIARDLDIDGGPALVVVDEAYAEFRREGTPSALELLADYPNLIVTRTMSKAFALAGGRLGYLAASREIVDTLRIVRLPYHLSSITQAVARAALKHRDELLSQVAALRAERDALVTWLRGLTVNGEPMTVAQSDANFVFFGKFEDRHAVWQGLLDQGVLIRESGPEGWLRVTVGNREEMTAFKNALVKELGL
ncbi:histidinol-phosphate transaminase [Populibacterium corticicola]|uniref:Histidinol-phosphate aminotransferase n=1 Tax=Populibacterium corticicola TaxID=1812826 RepID=A0ABW5XIX8_9MICO